MDQNIKGFLILNMSILVILALYFFRRRPERGFRLKMKGGSGSSQTFKVKGAPSAGLDRVKHGGNVREAVEEKTLNVIFTYNAHSWDAYEVLGIPAGSSMRSVKTAYKEALSKVDVSSRGFIDTAYQAICSKLEQDL